MNIQIDRGIPMPSQGMRKRCPITIALQDLEVNDSALMPPDVNPDTLGGYMRSAGRGTTKKFVRRTVAEGIRIWRVA